MCLLTADSRDKGLAAGEGEARKGNEFQAPLGALDLRPAQVSLVPLCLSSCVPKTIDSVCVGGGGGSGFGTR